MESVISHQTPGPGRPALQGGAGSDTLHDVQGDIERLRGGSANDTLTGDEDANVIYGGAGNDEIEGKNGNDSLYGQAGADNLYAQDGALFKDWLYCGTENDVTLSDAVDARNADCEVNTGF